MINSCVCGCAFGFGGSASMIDWFAAHEILMPLQSDDFTEIWFRSKVVCFVDTLSGAEKIVYGRNLCPRGKVPDNPEIPILMIELDFDSKEEQQMMQYLRTWKHPWLKWR